MSGERTASPRGVRRTRLSLVVGAVVAGLLAGLLAEMGSGSAAEAATAAPQLVGLTVTPTTVTPPGEVEIHYTATAGTSTIGSIGVYFVSPAGFRGNVWLEQQDAPLDGVVRWRIPEGLRNATYQLTSITLTSADRMAASTYSRDGKVTGGATHSFDFPSQDVTVSGSEEDFSGPVLTSVSVLTPTVKPGQPVTITWNAQDVHGLKEARFHFTAVDRPGQMTLSTTSAAELAAGRMTRPAPANLYNTKHALSVAVLTDSLGNETQYSADGKVASLSYDGDSFAYSSHTLPFASRFFTMSGSTFDELPPKLLSISLDKTTIRSSDPVTVSYATQDDTAPLGGVYLNYRHGASTWTAGLGASNLPLSGSYTAALSGAAYPGVATLSSVDVRDAKGNSATYLPDGTIRDSSGQVTGRHTLDLSHFDLTVLPSRFTVAARSRPQSAELSWSVASAEPTGLTGYEVTVNPGGRVVRVPNNGKASQTVIVPGLTNATRYTFTVRSLSSVGASPASASVSATPLISGNVWSAGDVNGDRLNDLFAAQPGHFVRLYRGKGGATLAGGTTVTENYWGGGYRLFPGDKLFGLASFYAVPTWDDSLEGLPVERTGKNTFGVMIGQGWGMRFIDGSADFTGDKVADLVGVTEGGNAYLYRSTTTVAKFTKGTQIASGWGSMQKIFAATDVTGDRRADLLGVDKAGVLWIFPGTGRGTFSPKRKVSSGWGGLGGLFSARDLNGDGKGDLGAVTMDGTLRVYKGRANGTFSSAVSVSKGWAPYL